jgi:hypothetical protein
MVEPFIRVRAQAGAAYAVLLVAVRATLGAGGTCWPYRRLRKVVLTLIG